MSRRCRVETLLRDEEWEAFHALLADRRTTVDAARQWLTDRGRRISRGAVHRHMRLQRDRGLPALGRDVGTADDGELRARVFAAARALGGRELRTSALVAVALMPSPAEAGRHSLDALEVGVRARKLFQRMGIYTIGELVSHCEHELRTYKQELRQYNGRRDQAGAGGAGALPEAPAA